MALPILNKIKQWDAFRIIRNLFADPTEWLNYGEPVIGTPSDRAVIGQNSNGDIAWLQGVNVSKESKIFAIDTVATGTGVFTFRVPYDLTVIEIRGSLTTASTSGAVTVDVNLDATSVFDTQKLEIDQDEKTSFTATNQAEIVTADWDNDQEVTIDIDDDGTSADELKVTMVWTPRITALALTGAFTDCDEGDPMGGSLTFSGGVPPYSIVSYTAPAGSSLSLSVDTVTDVGNTSTAADDQAWSVTGEDSEGSQVTVSGTVDVAPVAPTVPATWDPTANGAGNALTSSDRTVNRSNSGGSAYCNTLATAGISGDKRYFEITAAAFSGTGERHAIGLALDSIALNTGAEYLGEPAASVGLWVPSNAVYSNDAVVTNATDTTGTNVVYGFSVDASGGSVKVWIETPAGIIGGGDPEAGTSPTVTLAAGTYFPCFCGSASASGVTEKFTINCGQDAFSYGLPSGYVAGPTE